jgi:hypothetical protein
LTPLAAGPGNLPSAELLEYFSIFEFNGRHDGWRRREPKTANAG